MVVIVISWLVVSDGIRGILIIISMFFIIVFDWLRVTHPISGIEPCGQMGCAISNTSSLSATLDTLSRWKISQFNMLILPGVIIQLSFSCKSLNSLKLNEGFWCWCFAYAGARTQDRRLTDKQASHSVV